MNRIFVNVFVTDTFPWLIFFVFSKINSERNSYHHYSLFESPYCGASDGSNPSGKSDFYIFLYPHIISIGMKYFLLLVGYRKWVVANGDQKLYATFSNFYLRFMQKCTWSRRDVQKLLEKTIIDAGRFWCRGFLQCLLRIIASTVLSEWGNSNLTR